MIWDGLACGVHGNQDHHNYENGFNDNENEKEVTQKAAV